MFNSSSLVLIFKNKIKLRTIFKKTPKSCFHLLLKTKEKHRKFFKKIIKTNKIEYDIFFSLSLSLCNLILILKIFKYFISLNYTYFSNFFLTSLKKIIKQMNFKLKYIWYIKFINLKIIKTQKLILSSTKKS